MDYYIVFKIDARDGEEYDLVTEEEFDIIDQDIWCWLGYRINLDALIKACKKRTISTGGDVVSGSSEFSGLIYRTNEN